MPNLNKVFLMGNLTRDPELRFTPSGTAVGNFGIATNRRFKNSSGELQEEATFVDVDVFGRQAEVLNEYVHKGDPLFIEGRLKLDEWEAKDGSGRRKKLKIICEHFEFLSRRGDRETDRASERPAARASGPAQGSERPAAQATSPAQDDAPFDGDDNIPF